VADRVVMAAVRVVLEPIFEADFRSSSYGFRPGLSAHHALETVRTTVNRGRVWVLDADIQTCFDEISHDALVAQIERRVCDRRMVKLLRGWLRAGVFEGGIVSAIEAGTPQWSPISPLLANVALHVLDEGVGDRGAAAGSAGPIRRRSGRPVRHPRAGPRGPRAGGGGPGHARAAPAPRQDRDRAPPPRRRRIHLLGFHHRMRESGKRPGRWYLQKWPSRRAMASIKAKIRERTPPTIAHLPLERTVENLNPVLRGWGAYFRYGNSARKFATIDAYVNQRLAILASTKHGLRGWNRTTRFTHGWVTSLGVYRLTGTVRPATAYASR
jgi:RNA-directed DNA polymerase